MVEDFRHRLSAAEIVLGKAKRDLGSVIYTFLHHRASGTLPKNRQNGAKTRVSEGRTILLHMWIEIPTQKKRRTGKKKGGGGEGTSC